MKRHELKEDDEGEIDIPRVIHSTNAPEQFEAWRQANNIDTIEIEKDNNVFIEEMVEHKEGHHNWDEQCTEL